jgi:PD-(D/E)XK nuclease superfamily protein
MRFQPVFLPEDRALNGRVSQTFLRHYGQCPRSGFLYAMHRGEAPTRELVRGSAFHDIAFRSTLHCIEQGEVRIPPDIVKLFAQDVLSEMPVVFEDHDIVREMSYRWGAQTTFDPSRIIACETLFQLEVHGVMVRAKIDFAETIEDGAAVLVRDYKTARSAPPYEEIARVRPDDGQRAAKNFQLCLYAVLLAFGVPVRSEERQCTVCQGGGCKACGGSGRQRDEYPEPFPVAQHAQRFDLEFVYPAIELDDGSMATRPLTLNRLELLERRESLEAKVAELLSSVETGDWPAVVSDQACSECPASSQCPIPRELRDHRGTVNTMEEAAEAYAVLDREKAEHAARTRELHKWIKTHGALYFDGKVAEPVLQESSRIDNKDAMFAAMERAVQYGEPFERSDFVKVIESFPIKVRDATSDEVAEMSTEGEV